MAITNTWAIGAAYNHVTDCAQVTGITASANTVIKTIEIPPNNFGVGDIVTIQACITKAGSAGGYFYGLFWNTTTSLTNARKVCESLNPTDDGGAYLPPTATYSNIYYRLQIVGLTNSTRSYDPHWVYNNNGSVLASATASKGVDLYTRSTTTPASAYEVIGTQEGLGSIDWTFYPFTS